MRGRGPGEGQVVVEGVSLSLRTGERGNRRVGRGRFAEGFPGRQRSARGGSCHGVAGLADGAEEFIAGALDGLGGGEVGGCGGTLVEGVESYAGAEKGFGIGQGLEPLVGRGDVLLPVAAFDAAVGPGDLGGEEAGVVEVEEGTEVIAKEGVDLGDEEVGDVDVGRAICGRRCRSWTRPARCRCSGGAGTW